MIPAILGIAYFIIFPLAKGMRTEISTIGVEGGIYKNYITNYLVFIPILVTGIILFIKNKEKKYESCFQVILFVLSIIFAIILFIGKKLGIVSEYYFFKAYYIIWMLAVCNTYIALVYIFNSKYKMLKVITLIFISVYILATIISTLIFNKNIGINHIWCDNKEKIDYKIPILKHEEIPIIEKVNNLEEKQVYILSSEKKGKTLWMSVLYQNQYIYIDFITGMTWNIEEWLGQREEKYYFSYHDDYEDIETEYSLDENSDEYKIIHNDGVGFILERK